MTRMAKTYGDIFKVELTEFGSTVFVSDPQNIKEIFTASPDTVLAGKSRKIIAPVFGDNSILLLDGAEHLRQRRLLLPPLHGERVKHHRDVIREITNNQIDNWQVGKVFPTQPEFNAITLETIMRAVFGLDHAPHLERLRTLLRKIIATGDHRVWRIAVMFYLHQRLHRGPTGRFSPFRSIERILESIDELLFSEIGKRRKESNLSEREDIMSLLVQTVDEDGNPMSDQEIRDELITLLLAGHDTTGATLSWAFETLAHNRDKLEILVDEIKQGDSEEYTDAVVNELLRLRPVLPIAPRTLAEPFNLRGYELPEGTVVAPCAYLTHRREEIYPDPKRFLPERFIDSKPDTYSWLPFGGGVRRCIGAAFATLEVKTALQTVLKRVDFKAASESREHMKRRSIVLTTSRGGQIIATKIAPKD